MVPGGLPGRSVILAEQKDILLRHVVVEVRGLAGHDLYAGTLLERGQVLAEEIRDRLPG